MLERNAGQLLLLLGLAACGSEAAFEGPPSVPLSATTAAESPSVPVQGPSQPKPAARAPSGAGLPGPAWHATVARRIADSSFAIERREARFEAQNSEHGFKASFDARGVKLEPRDSLGFRIGGSALARGESHAPLAPATLALGACRSDGALDPSGKCLQRLEGARGQVTEFWENRQDGLEHSFIVQERIEGAGELSVWVGVENAKVTIDAAGTSAHITDLGSGQVYRYAGLRAWDSRGVALSARMRAQPGGLALAVDDTSAAYPITIDPVLAVPNWVKTGESDGNEYGYSVARAGDVNADGFDDVIVGASAGGTVREGRAYLYHGSASGLATLAAWTAESNNNGASFGTSVAGAGDVNGDGFDDVIVGAPFFANGQISEGRVSVYHGSATGLGTSAAWAIESNQLSAELGESVAGAGDVNCDGFDDVIVGAPGTSNGQGEEGRASVYLGSSVGLALTAAWTRESNQAEARLGSKVAGAGDVNGDGCDDIVLGTQDFDAGQTDEGRAMMFGGSPSGLSLATIWVAEGNANFARFGAAIAPAGDVNGDGFDDLIVGAPGLGRAFVYHGSAINQSTTPAATIESAVAPDFAAAVSGAGDVNGDSFADVIVGHPERGRAFVYHGSAAGVNTTAAWNGSAYQDGGGLYGFAVASAGDVDGDGFSDIIVGAHELEGPDDSPGTAFVYHGGPGGLEAPSVSTAESNSASSRYGFAVASAGDVNGDGFGDVIVGAPFFTNGQASEGRAYVYQGNASGIPASAAWTVESNQANSQLGYTVASAGDVNGDGFGDVIVGAPLFDNGQTNEGRALVYHGSAAGLATTAAWTTESQQVESRLGISVASAGDVNGDGFGDVIVGAFRHDNGQTDEGRAFVYHGSASGLAASAAWTGESNQASAGFGVCVASAGDVNGDGFGDVIVGAHLFDNGQADEGRAFAYHGSATGLATAPAWTVESNQASAAFGLSLSGAGDMNGDGFDEVIVGALQFDSVATDVGRAFIYAGQSSGLSTSAFVLSLGSNQASAFFGSSVAGAGDLNGDGFDDVVVGASGYDAGQSDEGAAFVFAGHFFGVQGGAPAFTLEGNQVGAGLGASVAGGDVNGDGLSDLIAGSYLFDNGQTDEGRVFVVR